MEYGATALFKSNRASSEIGFDAPSVWEAGGVIAQVGDSDDYGGAGKVGIAVVGAGYVADFYMRTMANYPVLELKGAFDRSRERLERFCGFYGCRAYPTLQEALHDPAVAIVVNLSSPESHYEICLAALTAGKHVYCEKPFTLQLDHARELADVAERLGLTIAVAPASLRSDTWRLVSDLIGSDAIGKPTLVYAEMEDGQVFRERWDLWRSTSGAPWPGRNEFEVGCTLEHSGYPLTWMVSLFGAVSELTTFSANITADKGLGSEHARETPDFSVGCLRFASGAVARLTCGLTAEKDRSLTIFGETGTIRVMDLWNNRSAVYLDRFGHPKRLAARIIHRLENLTNHFIRVKPQAGRLVRYPRSVKARRLPAFPSQIDFAAGLDHQARSILTGDDISALTRMALHVTEIAIELGRPGFQPQVYRPITSL